MAALFSFSQCLCAWLSCVPTTSLAPGMHWGPWNASSGCGSDAKWGCHSCPWGFWVSAAVRPCPAVTSPGTAAVSQDTGGGSGNSAAPQGQAEPHLPPGLCSKRGLLEPPSVPQERGCRLPDPCEPPKRHRHCHSLFLHGCQQHFLLFPQPWDFSSFKQAGANLTCSTRAAQGSRAVTLRAHTCLHTLLFDRNPWCFSSSSVSVWKAAPAPPSQPCTDTSPAERGA